MLITCYMDNAPSLEEAAYSSAGWQPREIDNRRNSAGGVTCCCRDTIVPTGRAKRVSLTQR